MLAKRFKFFQPTRQLRELRLLTAIERFPEASQRVLAQLVLLGPTMVHRYIGELTALGLLQVEGDNPRTFEYRLTPEGHRRRETLLFEATKEVVQFYGLVKQEFSERLRSHASRGTKRAVLFGAAETAEIVQAVAISSGIEILGLVDSDPKKHGQRIGDLTIQPPRVISDLHPDTVLITSFGHSREIGQSLAHLGRGIRVDLV